MRDISDENNCAKVIYFLFYIFILNQIRVGRRQACIFYANNNTYKNINDNNQTELLYQLIVKKKIIIVLFL